METQQNEQFQYSDGMSGPPTPSTQSHTGEKIVEQARRIASSTQQEVTDQVRSGVDSAKQRAADTLNTVAQSLVRATEQNDGGPNRYVQRTGEQVQRVADYLQNTDVRRIITQTESFARRQPALFLGGAFAVGILAARFLKNSSRQDDGYSASPVRGESGDWDRGQFDRERTMSSSREAGGTGARSDPVRYDDWATSGSRDAGVTDEGRNGGAGTARNNADGAYGSSWNTGTNGGPGTSGAADGSSGTGGPTGDR